MRTWRVLVVDYNPEWPAMFQAEADKIARILGDNLVTIHHIGSTSVPGLRAKPIIDMMPVVKDITLVDKCNLQMEELGYEAMGEFGLPGRRYFRKGGHERTHHVHCYSLSSAEEIERHLAFRDYLRAHPDVARAYGELKTGLAQEHPDDASAYMDGKDAFVKSVEQDAIAWRKALQDKAY
ncbi:MAG: GrpB family protein [Bacillota bacterium]|jgi:GrpB-like predicted nucleotidyltransferase (UPF0157 family)